MTTDNPDDYNGNRIAEEIEEIEHKLKKLEPLRVTPVCEDVLISINRMLQEIISGDVDFLVKLRQNEVRRAKK